MSFIFITVTRLDNPYFKPKNIRNSWAFICKVLVLILFSVDNLFIRIILIIKLLLITRVLKMLDLRIIISKILYPGFGNSSRAHLHHHQSPQTVVGMLTWISSTVGYWPVDLGVQPYPQKDHWFHTLLNYDCTHCDILGWIDLHETDHLLTEILLTFFSTFRTRTFFLTRMNFFKA